MKTRLLTSIAVALCSLVLLSGCVEPAEVTKLRRMQEPRVLAGTASAEQFWLKADAIAQAYRAPASERARLAEMIEIGRRADLGEISLDDYRAHHARVLARYEAQREEARRIAARRWSRVLGAVAVPPSPRLAQAGRQKVVQSKTPRACR